MTREPLPIAFSAERGCVTSDAIQVIAVWAYVTSVVRDRDAERSDERFVIAKNPDEARSVKSLHTRAQSGITRVKITLVSSSKEAAIHRIATGVLRDGAS